MDLLWQNEKPMTARQILEQLYPDAAKPQHGTVQRLLQRLEDKGYVERDRSLFVHLFSPAVSRQTYAGQQLESLADKLTAGSFAPLITHLVERKKISRDEILQRLVEILYERTDGELRRGAFRVRGDVIELLPTYDDHAYRIELWGDEIDGLSQIDPLTGKSAAQPRQLPRHRGRPRARREQLAPGARGRPRQRPGGLQSRGLRRG